MFENNGTNESGGNYGGGTSKVSGIWTAVSSGISPDARRQPDASKFSKQRVIGQEQKCKDITAYEGCVTGNCKKASVINSRLENLEEIYYD